MVLFHVYVVEKVYVKLKYVLNLIIYNLTETFVFNIVLPILS